MTVLSLSIVLPGGIRRDFTLLYHTTAEDASSFFEEMVRSLGTFDFVEKAYSSGYGRVIVELKSDAPMDTSTDDILIHFDMYGYAQDVNFDPKEN
jgi:hypothetical protein